MGLNLCLLHWRPLLYCWDTREAHVCVLLWTLYKCYTCYFETYIFFFKDNCSFLLTWMGLVNLFLMHYTINISLSENIAIYSSIFLLISIYVNIIFFYHKNIIIYFLAHIFKYIYIYVRFLWDLSKQWDNASSFLLCIAHWSPH